MKVIETKWARLSHLLESTAKYTVGLSLVATCFSFLINYVLFAYWGLNFAIVATPSDVIVGGLDGVAILLPPCLGAGLGISAAIIFDYYFDFKWKNQVFAGIPATLAIALSTIHIFDSLFVSNIIALYRFPIWSILFAFFVAISGYFANKDVNDRALKLIVVLSLLYIGFRFIEMSANYRFPDVYVSGGLANNCGESERLVWAGSNYLVTTCSRPFYHSDDEYFIIERANVKIHVRPSNKKIENGNLNAQTH